MLRVNGLHLLGSHEAVAVQVHLVEVCEETRRSGLGFQHPAGGHVRDDQRVSVLLAAQRAGAVCCA